MTESERQSWLELLSEQETKGNLTCCERAFLRLLRSLTGEPKGAPDGRVYRCKRIKPGDGGVVDGCGWQGARVQRCPNCGSNRFHIVSVVPEPQGAPPRDRCPTCYALSKAFVITPDGARCADGWHTDR